MDGESDGENIHAITCLGEPETSDYNETGEMSGEADFSDDVMPRTQRQSLA